MYNNNGIILFHLLLKIMISTIMLFMGAFPVTLVGQSGVVTRDSADYSYFHTDDIFTFHTPNDTLADITHLQKVTLWNENQHYANTGNYGSALWPLIFRPEMPVGFHIGTEVYQFYQVRPKTFRFFTSDTPVSDLFFSQLGNQNNLLVGADFSRSFTQGISMSLNYKRLSYAGQYLGADTKSTGFGLGFKFESPDKRHHTVLLFTQNANEEGHNGGVTSDSLVRDNPFRRSVPTRLRDATSRQQRQSYVWHQYLMFSKQNKSASQFYILNTVKYQPSYYQVSERVTDSLQHTQFYNFAAFDTRGMRRLTELSHWSEGLFLHAEKKQGISGRIGLTYDLFNLSDGPVRVQRNDVTASFNGYVPIFKTLFIRTQARLGLLDNIGRFHMGGQLDVKLSDWLILTGGLELFRSEPSYMSQNVIVNDIREIENDFNNPFGSVLSAHFYVPKISLKVGLTQTLIDQMIYYDLRGMPKQSSAIFNISQIYASHQLKWGIFGLDNRIFIQTQPNNILPLPDVLSSHQLYLTGRWFKKVMDVTFGIDARITSRYIGPSFHPLFMNFHQSSEHLNTIPMVHAFFMAKVSQFRALLMMDNISQYFTSETQYQVTGHPQFDPLFRLSLRWMLLD